MNLCFLFFMFYLVFPYIYRSIDYTINDQHQFHLVTTAQVVSVALELSCDKLTLKPTASLAAESGKENYQIINLTVI